MTKKFHKPGRFGILVGVRVELNSVLKYEWGGIGYPVAEEKAATSQQGYIVVERKMDRSDYQLGVGMICSTHGKDDMVSAPLSKGGDEEISQGGAQKCYSLIQGVTGSPPCRKKPLAAAPHLPQVHGTPEARPPALGVERLK